MTLFIRRSIALRMLSAFLGICLFAVLVPGLGGYWLTQRGVEYFQQEQNQYRSRLLYDYFLGQYLVENNWSFLERRDERRDEAADAMPEEKFVAYRLFFPTQTVTKAPRMDFDGPWWMRSLINTAIYDAEGRFLAGNRARHPDAVQTPFMVKEGGKDVCVGYLYKLPEFYFSPAVDQMPVILAAIAALSLLAACVCALAVWRLARHFRAPILHINAASRALAQGGFHVRVSEEDVSRQDELGELARHFNSMAQSLEDSEKQRRRMVADISHELRTPLTVMLGSIEGMRAGVLPLSEESLAPLADSAEGLNRLVEELRSLALMESGGLRCSPEPLCPVELIRSVAQIFADALQRQGLRLELDLKGMEGVLIHGDPARLRQVLQNLMHNTLRYTHAPGMVRVSGGVEGDCLLLVWENTPPCPGPEQLPLLFDRFYRCEQSRSRHSGGSGLGLAISREIMRLHGGDITADQSGLGGLRLIMSLPLDFTCPGPRI